MASIGELTQKAGQLANAGRWDEAESLWLEVRRLEPRNSKALFSLGVHALRRNDLHVAYELLQAAHEAASQDLVITMTLCSVSQQLGDMQAEREAIDAALAVDPYFLPALLAKGSWFERCGRAASAATTYANALKIAPRQTHGSDALRRQLVHAGNVVARRNDALRAHLDARLMAPQATLHEPIASRWREAASIMSGHSKPYTSECNQLHVPRLPSIPFFERAQFAWVAELEGNTDVIRSELLAALGDDRNKFGAYIAYQPGEPVNQWRELNHSTRWSAFHLWRGGAAAKENLERCPKTTRILAALEMADIAGLCPNAMFSVLAPKTHIPPHHGETNARVVVHLPLIVPDGCRFRVGFEERRWNVGEALIFDDTIEHEARNDSEQLRVILIFDVWNPLLSAAERDMVRAMSAATREFTAQHDRNTSSATWMSIDTNEQVDTIGVQRS